MAELTAATTRPRTPRLDPALEGELEKGPWDHRWQLTPRISTPNPDPGTRHRDWTLAATLREPVLDLAAVTGRPLSGLVVGSGEGLLVQLLWGLGLEPVVGVEADPLRLRRARLLAHHHGIAAESISFTGPERIPADPSDVVAIADMGAAEPTPILADARSRTRHLCLLPTTAGRRTAVAEAAVAAGFDRVEPARIPVDAERSYILGERSVLLAHVDAA